MKNKKAQIGKIITWIVATAIIVIILTISILVSSTYLGGEKEIKSLKTTDTLASKSLFSYLLTKDSEGNMIYEQLKTQENLNEFNGNLGKRIFLELYRKEYKDVWLGIILNRTFVPTVPNKFFGDKPTGIRPSGEISTKGKFVPSISEKIHLNQDKSLELVLAEEGSIK